MITTSLACQTRVAVVLGSLAVHDHRPEVHLIVHQGLGTVSVGKLDHDHLLVDGVKIVQPSLHHSQGCGLVNAGAAVQDCPSVGAVIVDRFNLKGHEISVCVLHLNGLKSEDGWDAYKN